MDESGNFTPSFGLSVVCVLSLPSKEVRRVRRQIEEASNEWPRHKGELKSGSLGESELALLIDILFRAEAVLHCAAMDVGSESGEQIETQKSEQCEAITRHLTPQHHPNVARQLWELRRSLEAMSQQLYVQSVIMRELVCDVLGDVSMYFSQRLPRELAQWNWTIDAKDPTRISTQERWWRDTFAPLVESRSERFPFPIAVGPNFQYKHFTRKFRLVKELWRPGQARRKIVGFNIGRLVTDSVEFVDSRSDILIQAIDVLTGFMRRALAGEITNASTLLQLGRLQIRRRRNGVLQPVVFLGLAPERSAPKHLVPLMGLFSAAGRNMLV